MLEEISDKLLLFIFEVFIIKVLSKRFLCVNMYFFLDDFIFLFRLKYVREVYEGKLLRIFGFSVEKVIEIE